MSVNGKSCDVGISDSILADILRYVAVVAVKILLELCQIILRNGSRSTGRHFNAASVRIDGVFFVIGSFTCAVGIIPARR